MNHLLWTSKEWKPGNRVSTLYFVYTITIPSNPMISMRFSWNSVHLDLDKDILTGFQNIAEVYPTFGINSSIQFTLYPWALGGKVVFYGGSTGSTPTFLVIVVEGATGDLLREINALTTVHLGRDEVYVTVPHRMFGDDGGMNLRIYMQSQ